VSRTTVGLGPVPEAGLAALAAFGAPESTAESKLYQALGNDGELLAGWVNLAWRLRASDRHTPVRLRELMIVLASLRQDCGYEVAGHRRRALAAGVSENELEQLTDWRDAPEFSEEERIAFALTEEMVAGRVTDATLDRLTGCFDEATRVELIMTAGFYCMSARVIDALRLNP
jgi:AhpD family alkylhydroperoxidase